MDYYEIGQRIRKYRKAHALSQEMLAERINVSTTHMSHIETGNTKLSLPVLVDIAKALEVSTDELIFGSDGEKRSRALSDLQYTLDRCDGKQMKIIADIVKALKITLDKNG